MAFQRLKIDGYGQVELNNVAFRRDGRIEAQYKLNATDFADVPIENGMIVKVDAVNREIRFSTSSTTKQQTMVSALVYSAEKLYDDAKSGLKNFKLENSDVYPRVGYLAAGDKFTTNCIAYDKTVFSSDDEFKTAISAALATPLDLAYTVIATESETGALVVDIPQVVSTTAKYAVTKVTTMPDGQYALQFVAL